MKPIYIPQLVVCVMMFIAFNPENPYGYYTLLRIVSFAAFGYLAFVAAEQEKKGWMWILGVTAIIYNPIIPIHLTREIWSVINLVTIFIALGSILVIKEHKQIEE